MSLKALPSAVRSGGAAPNSGSRPRVLLVAPVAVAGGVTEVLAGLCRRAEEGGYDAKVVFLRQGPVIKRFAAHAPVVLNAGRLRNPISFLRTVRSLDAVVRHIRPDVIVTLEPSGHLYAICPAHLHRIPAVWMHHGLPDPGIRLDRLIGLLPASAAIVNSQFVLGRAAHLTNTPLHLLRPGIDVQAMARGDGRAVRERFGIPSDAPLVGIVGRLQAWKGQQLFLDAAAIAARAYPDAYFVVVGGTNMGWEDPDYPDALRAQAERLGIASRVIFTGHSNEAANWFATIDVVVHASENEPYGLVICEALAAGRALVSVAQGGPMELVDDERTGLLTRREATSLAAAVVRLLADRPLRRRLGLAGQAQARARMSDARMARGFGSVLATVSRAASDSRRTAGRLRVLFVAPVSVQGGANEVLLALANPGPDAAYEALVVALRPGPLLDRLAAAGINHVLLGTRRLRSLVHTARALRQLDRIIARWQPDLVFSTEAAGHVYAALPAARRKVPALWRQPGRPDGRNPIDRLANRLPAATVAVASRFIAAEQEKIGSRPVAILPPGIDVDRLRHADGARLRQVEGIAADAIVITIVGRLQRWKGQDLFLDAAAMVAPNHPRARLAIVGGAEMGWETGDFPNSLRRRASRLGIRDRVHFAGQIDNVADWYAASDIVIHASDHEPFGLVICEAMLMGCAVIASNEGGPREIIEHKSTGLLVARTSVAIASAIEHLIAEPAERSRLGSAARAAASERFTSARMVRDFEALVRRHVTC